MALTTHLHLLPRLKVNGSVSLLPLYAFTALSDTTLPLYTCHHYPNMWGTTQLNKLVVSQLVKKFVISFITWGFFYEVHKKYC
jgi:hypothetical protein